MTYFHAKGAATLTLPPGRYTVLATHGLEYAPVTKTVEVAAGATAAASLRLERLMDLPARGWWSGDMHVHMNYGGAYVNDPARLRAQAEAEDLHVVEDLIVNKEQRIPDMGRFSPDSGSRLDRDDAGQARRGVPHELVGPHGTPRLEGAPHPSDLRRLRQHRRVEPLSGQLHDHRSRARAGRDLGLRPSAGSARARSGRRRPAHVCAAGGRRARQGGLRRGRRLQRSPDDGRSLVPAVEHGPAPADRIRHRRDGELRLAARPGRHEPRVRALGREAGLSRAGSPRSRRAGRSRRTGRCSPSRSTATRSATRSRCPRAAARWRRR